MELNNIDEKINEASLKFNEIQKQEFSKEQIQAQEMQNNWLSLQDQLDKGVPEITWVVDKLLVKNGITFFAGEPASGKSFIAMQLALDVSQGKPFLGCYQTIKGNVLYIDEENGIITLLSRFDKLKRGSNIQNVNNIFTSIFSNFKFDDEISTSALESFIETHDISVVIIDSMVRCLDGDENSSKDVRLIFETIKRSLTLGASFIILHHMKKDHSGNMNSLRGSSDFPAMADCVLTFSKKTRGEVVMSLAKNRHIDVSDLQDVKIKFENKEDEAIEIFMNGLFEPKKNAQDNCYDMIKEWIINKKVAFFTTTNVMGVMKHKGQSETTIYDSLKLLCEKGDIMKLRRGQYQVVNITEETPE